MAESLLSVENLSKSYGEKQLFHEITFGINRGQKTALIAPNGAGKSTLIKILSGKLLPDEGKVVFRNDLRIALLDQNPEMDESLSIADYIFGSDDPRFLAIKTYEKALHQLNKEENEENSKVFHEAYNTIENLGAWEAETKAKEILTKFQLNDLSREIGQLSGGERKKVALSRILIEENDLILLDEPTNHLDIALIEWLEEFLSRQSLSVLLITHDRYFLDRVCTDIIELERGRLHKYKGNFSYYLEKRAERKEREQHEMEKAKNLFKTEQEWMRKMPSARGTKAKARIDAFYELESKAHKKIDKEKQSLSVKAERIGGKILEIYNLSKKIEDKNLLDNFSYTFKKGDKIGIIGKNGIGKSTFLRMIMEQLKPDSGKIITGQTIKYGYYSQKGLENKEDKRAIELIKEVAEYVSLEDGTEMSASQFLERFGFNQTNQYTYFSSLSGGERRRLYLLKTLIENPNFLILDEPTNDLDIQTLQTLEEFLLNYQGCLLMVSHDRSFLDNLVDHLFVFEGEGIVKDFYGNYSDYLKSTSLEPQTELRQQKTEKPKAANLRDKKAKASFQERKEFGELTEEIKKLEQEKENLSQELHEPTIEYERLKEKSIRIQEILDLLDEKEMRWLELSERCE